MVTEITSERIDALTPWSGNARTHSTKQIRQIADSIETFGFTNPVLIDERRRILAGHGRVDGSARCRARAVAAGARRLGHPHHPSAAGRATGTSLRSAPAPRGGLRPPTRAPPRASDAARAVGGPTWCSAATAARARGRNAAGDGRGPHGRGRRASDGMVQIVPS